MIYTKLLYLESLFDVTVNEPSPLPTNIPQWIVVACFLNSLKRPPRRHGARYSRGRSHEAIAAPKWELDQLRSDVGASAGGTVGVQSYGGGAITARAESS